MKYADDGFFALLEGADAVLEFEDVAAQAEGFARGVGGGGGVEGWAGGGGGYVQAGGEGAAGACEEDGAHGGVGGEGCEDFGEVVPHSGGAVVSGGFL